MSRITEDQLEQIVLDWFKGLGYLYEYGPDIACDGERPERKDYKQVILPERLFSALKRLNPHVPDSAINDVIHVLSAISDPTLTKINRIFHKYLIDGVPVEYVVDGKKKSDRLFLMDFNEVANNQYLLVNQFSIKGEYRTRRPDIIVFINGLPFFVLELKNPADENADVWDAFNQLQTYKEDISELFHFNEGLIISDGITARVGSLTANKEWFMKWRTVRNQNDKPFLEYELEVLVKGFFDRELLLDYLRHFILFEQDDDVLIKKMAGYHQFHAVREAVRATVIAAQSAELEGLAEPRANYGNEVVPGCKKAGVIWHTQGSGKSISMACYAGKLLQQPEMKNPTIVVVTDRNDLDGQLYQTFCAAQDLLKQEPQQADSRDELRDMLNSRQSGGIIFTTIQKFSLLLEEKEHPVLNERPNIVVISDEAHRSQYGDRAKLNTKTGQYHYGYAKYLRVALPKATFIGFTGTPIALEDRNTQAVFGGYVSIYDIQDAVEDKATVKIFYESRLAKLDINQAEIEKLNQDVEDVVEDEEDMLAREKTKSVWSTLEKLVGAEPRIKEVAQDLVNHFEARLSMIDGKAMIVCMSREICVNMYNAITALRPQWHDADPEKGAIKVVMTGSASDRELLRPHVYAKQTRKRIEKRFKDANDELKIVIVRDMWLTGFDVPCCHTMYVDKPMKGHNLMQAIARVNRVYKNKEGGLVVDYIGIGSELKKALRDYTDNKGKGSPTNLVQEAYSILVEKMEVCRAMFKGFDYSAYETQALQLLVPATNFVLGLKDGKKRFLDVVTEISKAVSLCGTLDEVKPIIKEIAFFSAIKAAIIKYTTIDKKRSEEMKNSILKQILDNSVISEGVLDVFALAGLDRPELSLLSDEFLEEVRNMPSRNLAVELLERLLRDQIKSRVRGNVVQERKFGDRLLDTLTRYHNRAIETAQVMDELIKMAKDFRSALERNEHLGLNEDEIAFYDALANNESAVRELSDDVLKKIAVELTEMLQKNKTVDWYKRDNVRAKLRNMVRRLLKKYKYPPDKQQEAIDLVLEQATKFADKWEE